MDTNTRKELLLGALAQTEDGIQLLWRNLRDRIKLFDSYHESSFPSCFEAETLLSGIKNLEQDRETLTRMLNEAQPPQHIEDSGMEKWNALAAHHVANPAANHTPMSDYCLAVLHALSDGKDCPRKVIKNRVLSMMQLEPGDYESTPGGEKSAGIIRYDAMWQNALHRVLPNMGLVERVPNVPATYRITAMGLRVGQLAQPIVQNYPQFRK